MSTVKACLAQKPQRVIHVSSADTVHAALVLMKENRVRAVLVLDSDRLAGIITQGDCAIRVLLAGRDAGTTKVAEVMTRNPMTVKLGDPMEVCMGLMVTHSIRHLPVVANDTVIGLISIGDVVKQMMSELGDHVSFLETYIKGHGA